MKKFFKLSFVLIISFCLILMILNPDEYLKSSLDGLILWATVVLPSLLPFFFFTTILTKLGVVTHLSKLFSKPCAKLFRSGGVSAYAFIMSLLSGYPVGSKIISDLSASGLINKDESTRLACLCSTSGPLFIVGCVGIGMFSSKSIGYTLFLSHVISAFFCGIIFRFYGKEGNNLNLTPIKDNSSYLYDCVYSSVISVACVGGFICVFKIFLTVAMNFQIFSPILNLLSPLNLGKELEGFLYGFIECTNGCKMLASCRLSTYSVAFASSLISLGGISVWFQSISFLSKAKVNVKIFCLSKLLQATISFILALVFSFIFGF